MIPNIQPPPLWSPQGWSPNALKPTAAQIIQQGSTVVPPATGGISGLYAITLPLTIAEIHSLNTVPKQILAGIPNTIIMPVMAQWASNVTAAITTSQSANVKWIGVGNLVSAALATVTTGVTGRKSGTAVMTTITLPAGTDLSGLGLEFLGTAACTGGAGTFQLTVAYYLLPAVP